MKIILGRRKDPLLVDKEHLQLLLENVFTLPRHSQRNSTLTDSIGQYVSFEILLDISIISPRQIMRKFGRLGLLTGTQIFQPSKFHDMVSVNNCSS